MSNNSAHYKKTPTVFQMEATECGAASLGMIMAYYGKHMPLEQLRIETGVSRDGCTAKYVLRAAKKFGLDAHGYRKNLESLLSKDMPIPCIIHWCFNHFVVYEGKKGDYYYINDPAVGRRKLTYEDLDECYTGVALTFTPTKEFVKEKKNNTIFELIAGRLKGQESAIAMLFILGLLLVIPNMVVPIFSEVFIDEILLKGNTDWTSALLFAMGGTLVCRGILSITQGKVLQKLQNKMSLVSAYKFISHMIRLPISFFDQRYAGDLTGRIENNNNVSDFLAGKLADVVLDLFISIFYFILMLFYSPLLSLISVFNLMINVLVMKLSEEFMSNNAIKMQQDQGKLQGSVTAGITINETLKASGAENGYISRILGYYSKTIGIEQSLGKTQQLLNSIPEVSGAIANILILMIGGLFVINGKFTAGMLVAFTSIQTSFETPVKKIVSFFQQINTLKADINRVEDIEKYEQDTKFQKEDIKYEKGNTKLSGKVELRDISFGYSRLKDPLIKDFSFILESGKSIAFAGASGSGKSTVSKVISGLYEPWSGELLFDGKPIDKIGKEIINGSISTVSQDITLFSGTIRENLTMWNTTILEEDMVQAAKDACIHDDITKKPEAYDYFLTENGKNMSGGQKQRLEIARALASNPSILIMDEATSALDPIVEKKIIDNIKRRGCTCIIVAHRLSAIRDCDEIIIMSGGEIVQRGTHEELVKVPGHYQRLVSTM